ncbi:MAG: pentapeptide repeat-containing protein [Candidatus Sabulitectum sp.]|nr:pentapeptide repeat-containing protein [Candidatus Sabulitectum sp.]
MQGTDYSGQDLKGKDFRSKDLRNCRFVGCDMRGADLRNANLSAADFTGADLQDARMLGAIMNKTIGAQRNGGCIVSVVGLQYPILIDGTFITFACSTINHIGKESLDYETLLKLDKHKAIRFHALGAELLKWYRETQNG